LAARHPDSDYPFNTVHLALSLSVPGTATESNGESRTDLATPDNTIGSASRFFRTLGPGLITGASDDDPSGIGTYSQAGAQLGFSVSWTMLFSYPLMVAIQEISARLGRTTGRGIGGNVCRHYPRPLVHGIVVLLLVANTINLGADLGAMGDALSMLLGGSTKAYVVLFGVFCIAAQIFLQYARYVQLLKWLTLTLFAYVAALAAVNVPWLEALLGVVVPTVTWNSSYFTTLVAIAGTTISPYLFFWQAAQEAEEVRVEPERAPLRWARWQAPAAFARIQTDTTVGMGFSNLIAIAIMITTAATLNAHNVTNIETSSQAAEALRPIAGDLAYLIFALGIIGTGLLGVPVLAGSAAYAIGEAWRAPVGLTRQPREALTFYVTLAVATLVGIGFNFTPISPIKALYWSAVINGVVAMPIMVILMMMTARSNIMGEFTIRGWLRVLGWTSTGAMAFCVVGMGITSFL
jgi:Mn2+/Fe2+ NRAMP family transporter